MVAAAVIDHHAAALVQPVDLEGGEEGVQDAGVIGVLHVLEIELPVVGQHLCGAAEHLQRLGQHAADARGDFRPEIALEVGRILGKAAEYQAAEFDHMQLAQVVLLHAEFRRHAALALDAVLEGDAGQPAFEVVAPAVIDAGDVFRRWPRRLRQSSAPRWAQRFTKQWILPSRPRATTTGVSPTQETR